MLSQAQLRALVRNCAEQINQHNDQIRTIQNNMLNEVPLEQFPLAMAVLDAILGKNRIIHMAENTTFSNVGVANTGEMSGTITGSSQHVDINSSATELLEAFGRFRNEVLSLPSLTPEQKEDALVAVTELEEQAKKPVEGRIMGKVRNAVAALKTLSSGATALHGLYDQVHPLLLAHFHLPH